MLEEGSVEAHHRGRHRCAQVLAEPRPWGRGLNSGWARPGRGSPAPSPPDACVFTSVTEEAVGQTPGSAHAASHCL